MKSIRKLEERLPDLLHQISEKRRRLIEISYNYDLTDYHVVQCSQELDLLLNQLNQIESMYDQQKEDKMEHRMNYGEHHVYTIV